MSFESSGNANFAIFIRAHLTIVTVATSGKPQMPQNGISVLNIVYQTSCQTPVANELIMGTK